MRIRHMLLTALAAVALSGAPAHASGCPIRPLYDPECISILPEYWQDPTQPCLTIGCDWLVIY